MWSGVPWILWLYMSVILVVVCIIVELMCSKEKMVVKTFQKKETKHGFCFVARTWMENGSDQMCDRIEQFLGYIGLTCQFLSLTPLHKCLYMQWQFLSKFCCNDPNLRKLKIYYSNRLWKFTRLMTTMLVWMKIDNLKPSPQLVWSAHRLYYALCIIFWPYTLLYGLE